MPPTASALRAPTPKPANSTCAAWMKSLGHSRPWTRSRRSGIRTWFETVNQTILQSSAGFQPATQQRIASLQTSANSKWRKAKSVFRPRCSFNPIATKICITKTWTPSSAPATPPNLRTSPKLTTIHPAKTSSTAPLEQWESLEDRDLFLAIGHELAFGLRIHEFSQARWNWHKTEHGYPVLDG